VTERRSDRQGIKEKAPVKKRKKRRLGGKDMKEREK
jgi:hypothetical protein